MKLPNWFRITWWVVLIGVLTWYLRNRYPELVAGRANASDVVVFVVWFAVLLAPLFQEVSLLGLSFKQEVEELKEQVTAQISSLRAELVNAVDVRTNIAPQIHFPAPPPDTQLPALEERISRVVTEVLASHGVARPIPQQVPDVDPDVELLFRTRYQLEREIRRLLPNRPAPVQRIRHLPAGRVLQELVAEGIIEPELARSVQEVYSVCSPGVHGEPVSESQVEFVRETGPQLLAALRAIE